MVKAWQYMGMSFMLVYSSKVHAYKAQTDQELVLTQARNLDKVAHDQRGPLHGVVIGIKDIMDTKGDALF